MKHILQKADIHLNGARPWDITIHNKNLLQRVKKQGVMAFGDSYVEGWWDCEQLDVLFTKMIQANIPDHFINHPQTVKIYQIGRAHV